MVDRQAARVSAADIGERLGNARLTCVATLGLLAIVAVVAAILLPRVRRAQPKKLTTTLGRMRKFSPAFGLEMAVFVLVCLTAGVCEELLYRGWLMNLLRVETGSAWIAVAVGSAVFGIGHVYQGVGGALRAGFIGVQLAVLFLAVDSLVPGQVLHASVDVMVGFIMATAGARLAAAEAESGAAAVSDATGTTG